MEKKLTWVMERRALNSLKPFEFNPRIIKGKKFEDLKKSIDEFGLAEPLVINTDGTIIGGHGRYFALLDRGDEWVDCYVPNITLNLDQVKELNIRLNKNIAGEWDFEMLSNAFDIEDLKNWGFENHEFGSFDFGSEDEQGKLDESALNEKSITCPECGHVWVVKKEIKHAKTD